MADQTERIIIEIDGSGVKGEAQQVERAINTIGDAADKAGKKVTTAEKGINELGGALKTTGSSAKVTEREFNALQTSIGKTRPTLDQADALKQVANSAKQSASEMANLGRNAGGGVGQIRGITSAATPAASAMSSLSGAAGLLVRTLPMVGAAIGTIKLGTLIQESTMLAARFETLGVAMDVVGKNAGYTPAQLTGYENALRKTGISAIEARNNITKMASANMDLANATKLARIAQDAAVIGNTNSSEAFQRMIYGIQSGQTEILRTIGINVNFEQSYKKLADQLGKTSAELTESEKITARQSVVMEKSADIAGTYAASLETAGKKLGSLARPAEDAKIKIGEVFQPALIAFVDAYAASLKFANEQLDKMASYLDRFRDQRDVTGLGVEAIVARIDRQQEIINNAEKALSSGLYSESSQAARNYRMQIYNAEQAIKDLRAEITKLNDEARVETRNSNRLRIAKDLDAAAEATRKADEELKKLTETELEKLTAVYDKLKNGVTDRAALDQWYNSEVAKLNEKATKKFTDEQKKQLEAHKKAREAMLAGGKAAEQAIADWQERYDKRRVDAIAESTAKTVKIRVDAEKEAADAATAILEKQQADAQKVMDNIQDATADVFYDLFNNIEDGWSNLWSSMKEWALRTLAELAARAATVNIVVPIMTSMTGTANATQAVQAITGGQGGGFNLSSLSSLVQPGSMLSKIPGMSAVTGMLATQLPGTTMLSGGAMSLAAGGTAGGPVASLAAAQNLAGMTGGLSVGAALGMGGLGGLGYSLLGPSLGLPQNQYSGITSSLGGALGAWGGSALASSSAGAALGATVGSALPVVGTVAGALIGGLASGLFGGKKGTPRVQVSDNTIEWGQAEVRARGWSGMKKEGVRAVEESLEAYLEQQFAAVDAALAGLGGKYLDMVKGQTITFGRDTPGNDISWHWSHKKDDTAKAQEVLRKKIYEAASGAFTAAGQDIASGDDAMGALGMLAEANAAQFRSLQDALAAGVQSGNVEAYIAQLQNFQSTIQAIVQTWDSINAAADDLVKPPTAYESAVRQANSQFDQWIATLDGLGFAQAQIEEIEGKRAATLARLNAEMGPLAEAEAARAKAEASRATALADAERAVETARGNLRAAYQREAAEIEATARKWDSFAASLKKWRDDIMTGSMSPIPASSQADLAASRYQDVLNRAKLGDEDAIAELQGVAGQQLTVAKDTAKTAEDYARSALRTLAEVKSVESVATRHADIARQQLEALTSQVEALITINESVLSVEEAINALAAAQAATAQRAAAAAPPTSVAQAVAQGYITSPVSSSGSHTGIGDSGYRLEGNTLYFPGGGSHSVGGANAAQILKDTYGLVAGGLNGTLIRTRASGGYTPPGLTLVGEEGPELVDFGSPGHVWTADETRKMLSGSGSDGSVMEIRSLREDIRAIGRALAKNTADTARMMQRWDGDGMPEVRVA